MKYIVAVLFCIYSFNTSAQTDSALLISNVKLSVDSMQTSFTQSNWELFTHFMHPDLIKLTGGEQKFLSLIKSQMSEMDNLSIDTISSGNVLQLINHNGQWQCIVETYMQMTIESQTVSTISGTIGVSDDGVSWKFIRVATGRESNMVNFFSSLSPSLRPPLNKTAGGKLMEMLKDYKPEYPESSH